MSQARMTVKREPLTVTNKCTVFPPFALWGTGLLWIGQVGSVHWNFSLGPRFYETRGHLQQTRECVASNRKGDEHVLQNTTG